MLSVELCVNEQLIQLGLYQLPIVLLKGAPIAKFWISTSEFGHETLTIGFVVPQNPGSDGWKYRFEHQCETTAIFIFLHEDFMWPFFDQWRLIFRVKFILRRLIGSQGAIFNKEILRKNKPRFLRIFLLKNFRFFLTIFCGFS